MTTYYWDSINPWKWGQFEAKNDDEALDKVPDYAEVLYKDGEGDSLVVLVENNLSEAEILEYKNGGFVASPFEYDFIEVKPE